MPGPASTSRAAHGLEIQPFRAAYPDPRRLDLGDVVCPPYDVVEPAEDERLRRRSPYNAVHLIRPRTPSGESRTPAAYAHAARLAATWTADGVLQRDGEPALYVYEQVVGGARQLGVLGVVRLRPDRDRVVLPHEDVFPGPVEDRRALMAATNAQLEPILLATSAPTNLAQLLQEVVGGEPWLQAAPPDATEHRVWRVSGGEAVARIQQTLAATQGLIADGHHRYAAYERMQRERSAGGARGPWDFGLALVVGSASHGLNLSAIHRSVRGATLAAVLANVDRAVSVTMLPDGIAGDVAALLQVVAGGSAVAAPESTAPMAERRTGTPSAGAVDGVVEVVVTDGRTAAVLHTRVRARSRRAGLAATVTAEHLLPALFGVTDNDQRVGYHHEATEALRCAVADPGVAILLPAPHLADVVALAADGERMPRKSTSFGPKPRGGLILRFFDSGV